MSEAAVTSDGVVLAEGTKGCRTGLLERQAVIPRALGQGDDVDLPAE